MLSDEDIIEKYRDINFAGAFSGARNFQVFLKTELNEDIPLTRIYQILKKLPFYVISQKPIRRFPRRKYSIAGFGCLMQSDLAFMFEKNGYKYFLVLIDVFSRHLYVEILKDKSANTVKKAFEKIFSTLTSPITKIETDEGGEFVGLKSFFKKEKILFSIKAGTNKASFSEHIIYLIKRRLYMMMRSEVSTDWPQFLPLVVDSLNKKHIKQLGNISPSEINSDLDDVKIRDAQKLNNVSVYQEPSWKQQNMNQENFSSSGNAFQVGQHVYMDKKTEVFDKSFFAQVILLPIFKYSVLKTLILNHVCVCHILPLKVNQKIPSQFVKLKESICFGALCLQNFFAAHQRLSSLLAYFVSYLLTKLVSYCFATIFKLHRFRYTALKIEKSHPVQYYIAF